MSNSGEIYMTFYICITQWFVNVTSDGDGICITDAKENEWLKSGQHQTICKTDVLGLV